MGSRDDSLTRAQFDRLLSGAKDSRTKLVILCAGDLGLRESEIAHFKKSWVDFQSGSITIPSSQPCGCAHCSKQGGWKPKTRAGARTIPARELSPRAFEAIRLYCTANEELGIHRNTVWREVRRAAQAAGLEFEVYPHALRATAATEAAYSISSPWVLCDLFGWSSITTALYYIRRSGEGGGARGQKERLGGGSCMKKPFLSFLFSFNGRIYKAIVDSSIR